VEILDSGPQGRHKWSQSNIKQKVAATNNGSCKDENADALRALADYIEKYKEGYK
jgi:hypothetical protein